MFFGNYPATVDDKGRIHIPSVLSKLVDSKALMIAQWGECLAVFPQKSFEQMGERLLELGKDKKNREKVHRIVSSFFPSEMKSGKLLIPQELRSGSKINRKIQIVGMLKHIEIWNQSDWKKKDLPRKKKSIRDDLDGFGIL